MFVKGEDLTIFSAGLWAQYDSFLNVPPLN